MACLTPPGDDPHAKRDPDPLSRDKTGKVHGVLPPYPPGSWSRRELQEVAEELEASIRTRVQEQLRLGEEGAHRARINDELRLLRQIERLLGRS